MKGQAWFKVVEAGSLAELEAKLNCFLGQGWFLEDLDIHRTEFFASYNAFLVSKRLFKQEHKFQSSLEKKPSPHFIVLKEGHKRKGLVGKARTP